MPLLQVGSTMNRINIPLLTFLALNLPFVTMLAQPSWYNRLDSIVSHSEGGIQDTQVLGYDSSGQIKCIVFLAKDVMADRYTVVKEERFIQKDNESQITRTSYDSTEHGTHITEEITKCDDQHRVASRIYRDVFESGTKDMMKETYTYSDSLLTTYMKYINADEQWHLQLTRTMTYTEHRHDISCILESVTNHEGHLIPYFKTNYTYTSPYGLLSSATYQSSTDGQTWNTFRQVYYQYNQDNQQRCITTVTAAQDTMQTYIAYDNQGNIIQQTIYDIKGGIPTWQQSIVYTYRLDIESTDIKGYDARTDTTDIPVPGYKPNHPLICSIVYDKDGIIEETRYYYSKHRLNESK